MRTIWEFLIGKMTPEMFARDEKMTLLEELIYRHEYDEDIDVIYRNGFTEIAVVIRAFVYFIVLYSIMKIIIL